MSRLFLSLQAIFLFGLFIISDCFAHKVYPRSYAGNKNLKIMTYNPRAIHVYKGKPGVECSIVFSQGEAIETFAMGNPTNWQVHNNDNRLFIKPTSYENVSTNGTIITNMNRVYHFHFDVVQKAKKADTKSLTTPQAVARDDEAEHEDDVFEVVFDYGGISSSEDYGGGSNSSSIGVYETIPNILDDGVNINYKVAGVNNEIKPSVAMDDGIFTYLKFNGTVLPAIFSIDNEGYEGLINFRVHEDYLIIEGIYSALSLRHGDRVACVFNEDMPLIKVDRKRRSRGIFKKSY